MLKTLANYLRYSGLFVRITVNPLQWQVNFEYTVPTQLDPKMYAVNLVVGPVALTAIIDDGSW